MKIYEVEQKYFDNGKVKAKITEYELETIPENESIENQKCDLYRDYFTDKATAQKFYEDALKA